MSICINVLKEPAPSQQTASIQCPFSLYVAEKLSQFDRVTRMVAEKRITDILFELEMKENTLQPFGQYQFQPATELTDPVGNVLTSHESNASECKLQMTGWFCINLVKLIIYL